MNADTDTIFLLVAITIAALMGASYARARRAYVDMRRARASVPLLRSTAISEALRAIVGFLVALGLLYALMR